MTSNISYQKPSDLNDTIPVFPLPGALLLPRGEIPLNIFEPRYVTMLDDAISSGKRLIGMIQPREETESDEVPEVYDVGCVGRITQFSETGDGRYIISLTGICRFNILEELTSITPYRQFKVDYSHFKNDLNEEPDDIVIDRDELLQTLDKFLKANDLEADWEGIENAPSEALVNALSMMSPFDTAEKQALLEAKDLKTRSEILVAMTQIMLARNDDNDTTMQ